MKRWQIGDKMGEDGRDAAVELGVYEADAADTDDAEVWAEAKEPVDGDLVLKIELILLDGAIVPDAHYHHEDEGQDDGDPGSFLELDERRREVQRLDGAEEHDEPDCQEYALVPAQDYHQRHQTCGDQHDSYYSQPCFTENISTLSFICIGSVQQGIR
jgi:hypothetical protein